MGQLSPGFSLPRVQEQGMIMILARVFVPTVATFLPQPRVLSSPNAAPTTLRQKSSSALIQVTGVLTRDVNRG